MIKYRKHFISVNFGLMIIGKLEGSGTNENKGAGLTAFKIQNFSEIIQSPNKFIRRIVQ